MPEKHLMGHDPLTGISDYFVMGDDGKSFTMVYEQDMDAINRVLDFNQSEQNEQSKSDRWGDGKIIATIPAAIYNQMLIEGWAHDTPKLRSWLNDSSNRKFRRWTGRV
jgi:hypothetical protein